MTDQTRQAIDEHLRLTARKSGQVLFARRGGFTSGIAVPICASQLKDLGGLSLPGAEPGPLFAKLAVLFHALPTLNAAAPGIGLACSVIIFGLRSWRPDWPGMLIAVVLATFALTLVKDLTFGIIAGCLLAGAFAVL